MGYANCSLAESEIPNKIIYTANNIFKFVFFLIININYNYIMFFFSIELLNNEFLRYNLLKLIQRGYSANKNNKNIF